VGRFYGSLALRREQHEASKEFERIRIVTRKGKSKKGKKEKSKNKDPPLTPLGSYHTVLKNDPPEPISDSGNPKVNPKEII
jgi:hypothetical protein